MTTEIQLDLMGGARERAFEEFHAANPRVWELFERFALELVRAGRRRIGARLIGERIRWECAIATTDAEFKVNDHHWPHYARMFAEKHGNVFEFRDRHEAPRKSRRATA